MNSIKHYLQQALTLAAERRGFCAPNPAVGAVVVKASSIIGEGNHFQAGHPHAEINALKQAGSQSTDATLYVTLEPCSHTGRTPPCVDAIINANITKVYFGFYDPNPLVAGQGQARLQQAGITCEHIELNEINQFYKSYHHWTLHKKPWVTVKIAISKDGKIALKNGDPAKITGTEANNFTHQKRLQADALLTTVNTVISDNPQFTARINKSIVTKPIYLLDRTNRLPHTARIHTTAKKLTAFHSENSDNATSNHRETSIPADKTGLALTHAIQKIGEDGIHDLWVEVGARAFDSFIKQGIADEVYLYQANTLLGEEALPLITQQADLLTLYKQLPSHSLGADTVHHFIKQGI